MNKQTPFPSAAAKAATPAPSAGSDESPDAALAVGEDATDSPADEPEPYNLAEYRWVPVRRRARFDGWTEEKQRRFIEILADTGQVRHAARAVGLTPEGAYKLRRSAHAAAFARAWDAARHHAGSFLEDVAFERAIEGFEQNVYDEYGEVIATKRTPNDRLLMFLLRHLKPERYAAVALASPAAELATVEASLREMEPQLPAPATEMFDDATLLNELDVAEVADGKLPGFHSEQRPEKSAEQLKREAWGAQEERGEIASKKLDGGAKLSTQEWNDMCRFIDPAGRGERPKKRYR